MVFLEDTLMSLRFGEKWMKIEMILIYDQVVIDFDIADNVRRYNSLLYYHVLSYNPTSDGNINI